MLENLGAQATDMLIARRRLFLAYWLIFLRTGFWPIPVMVIGLLYPETRTLEAILLGWLAMLVVSWVILFGLLLPGGRWRHMRPQRGFLFDELHGSLTLYVKDVSVTVSAFLDRFLISAFLGLELTGVYTLFWSIANVVHSLAVYGVVQAQLPLLVASAQSGDQAAFGALERRLQIEMGGWALLLAHRHGDRHALVPALSPPAVGAGLSADLLDRARRDIAAYCRRRLWLRVAGAQARSCHCRHSRGGRGGLGRANVVLTPLAGLVGAATAYVITSGGLFARALLLQPPGAVPRGSRHQSRVKAMILLPLA